MSVYSMCMSVRVSVSETVLGCEERGANSVGRSLKWESGAQTKKL